MTSSNDNSPLPELVAPLAGWVLPLTEVPDPVFGGGLAGDGVAIDPTGDVLHAPCGGIVALMGNARHALTLKGRAGDVLMHIGIDTVRFSGAGFDLKVRDGETVRAGQPLLAFDLDAIVRGAPSAVTPIVLASPAAGRIVRRRTGVRVRVGEFLFAVEVAADSARSGDVAAERGFASRWFRVPFEHGLHARPAARVAAALAAFEAEVVFHVRGRSSDARSTVALMALGTDRGEVVEARASGREAAQALAALAALLEPVVELVLAAPSLAVAAKAALAPPAPGARLTGVVAVRGLAVGTAVPLHAVEVPVMAACGDAATERRRLVAAMEAVADRLRGLAAAEQGTRRGLLDAHLALLGDPQLLRRAGELLRAGASAGLAWRGALREAAAVLARLADPRMAERRADLADIEQQVLRVLAGAAPEAEAELPEGAIVLAGELLPSQLLSLNAARLTGLCMAGGGATSHVAILAASMSLPTLVGTGESVLAIARGAVLVLDAEEGVLVVEPPAPERERAEARVRERVQEEIADAAAAQLPAVTRDGGRIRVHCNLGAAAEAERALRAGAEGCGLLRTEFLFLDRERAPDVAEQLAVYQDVARQLARRVLTIRTLDAGGDKPLAYAPLPHEDNPALGLRGLRTGLAHPALLAAQLEAIARVEPAGQCRVLLPMVTDIDDLRGVRERLAALSSRLGRPAPALGIMIETPAAALLADQLAAEVDFLSIGSNDLAQYTLAMDRLHPILAPRLDGLHPAVLRLIELAARAGRAHAIEVGVCGGLASDPQAVPLLIGLGVQELSVAPGMIARIKSVVRSLVLEEWTGLARQALELGTAVAVRALVRARLEPRAADCRE